jgi:hypothetical protein
MDKHIDDVDDRLNGLDRVEDRLSRMFPRNSIS